MAPSYLSPGVYVEEIDGGTKPIESVGTAVAAFVGYTAMANDPRNGSSILGKPTMVTNWGQFTQAFGGFVEGAYLPEAVWGYFNNGGSRAYIVSVKALGGASTSGIALSGLLTSGNTNVLEVKALDAGAGAVKVTSTPNPAKEGDPQTFNLVVQAGRSKESYDGVSLRKGEKTFVETMVNGKSKLITVTVVTSDAALIPTGELNLEAPCSCCVRTSGGSKNGWK